MTPQLTAPQTPVTAEPTKLGRKRDHSRDQDILNAALDILAETGYEGMTIDMVAARAKAGKATLYRRWPSKGELVVDAVACMKNANLDAEHLPDTGSLRGDLVAMIRPHSIEDGARKMKIMLGLTSMLSSTPELMDATKAAIFDPRVAVNRTLLQRAIDRGEISAETDIDSVALVSPSMVAYRSIVQRKTVDRRFLLSVIDGVILPAVGLGGTA